MVGSGSPRLSGYRKDRKTCCEQKRVESGHLILNLLCFAAKSCEYTVWLRCQEEGEALGSSVCGVWCLQREDCLKRVEFLIDVSTLGTNCLYYVILQVECGRDFPFFKENWCCGMVEKTSDGTEEGEGGFQKGAGLAFQTCISVICGSLTLNSVVCQF